MKFKYLIIVSLVLTVLTIAAVSASEDADNLTASEVDNEKTQEDIVLSADEVIENDIINSIDETNGKENYVAQSSDKDILKNASDTSIRAYLPDEIAKGNDFSFEVYSSDNLTVQNVSLKIDNVDANLKLRNHYDNMYIFDVKDFNSKYGKSIWEVSYSNQTVAKGTISFEKIAVPYSFQNGYIEEDRDEWNWFSVQFYKGATGTAYVYFDGVLTYKHELSKNAYKYFPVEFDPCLTYGEHELKIVLDTGSSKITRTNTWNYLYKKDYTIIEEISNKDYIVSLNIPSNVSGTLKVNINGKDYSDDTLNGKAFIKVANLKGGYYTSHVSFISDSDNITHKSTVMIKPAYKLSLNTVKIKKSAKKITLKSVLKINGNVAKNKKVKFTFNKKTYTAKTNKNGVAKLNIGKTILKKLKVGKTIKYQVSYGKTVVKKSAKVVK